MQFVFFPFEKQAFKRSALFLSQVGKRFEPSTKGEKMKKLMVIAALLVFMVGSAAYAADWNFYGSARVSTFYTDWENDFLRAGKAAHGIAPLDFLQHRGVFT